MKRALASIAIGLGVSALVACGSDGSSFGDGSNNPTTFDVRSQNFSPNRQEVVTVDKISPCSVRHLRFLRC